MPEILESCTQYRTSSPADQQVARFRGSLDWMLAHPKWEDALVCSLLMLGFKGKRQGIKQRSALRSLPLEQKQELVRHALAQGLPIPSFAEAKRLAQLWGVTSYRARSDFGRPSQCEWETLSQRLLIRISARYELYKSAQSELFAAYHGLAVAGAVESCSAPSQREDACQEARLALLEAIDHIDPSQNFEAYARRWIKRRVLNFVMTERLPVKAPINVISKSFRGVAGANPLLLKAIREGTLQLDQPDCPEISSDPNLTSEPANSPQRTAMQVEELACLRQALSQLTEKQREVISCRFGLGEHGESLSLSQVADRVGISRQQIFQREKRALQSLKTALVGLQRERQFQVPAASGY
ncbi:sigma-70 family RNA polymerase sigma factor [Pelagicoccus enzymogenes]|uniref:sigma-70 family RNA polymerase sigma factor n=1 Tax=Pelagicoccus enzymogenes TaxID=2773457 RepID=UPI0028105319|nr:sigma-70 family RNA polymerase sigma factor [Pelagicoccus enzymogenes]MDQ8197117.1 sigma-70 family RNA polymerase sigma factor [Pelagicoccus enzymogenes]